MIRAFAQYKYIMRNKNLDLRLSLNKTISYHQGFSLHIIESHAISSLHCLIFIRYLIFKPKFSCYEARKGKDGWTVCLSSWRVERVVGVDGGDEGGGWRMVIHIEQLYLKGSCWNLSC